MSSRHISTPVVITEWHQKLLDTPKDNRRDEYDDMLHVADKLATAQTIGKIWRKLREKGVEPMTFARAVVIAYIDRSDDWDKLTADARRKRAERIANLSRKLADELHGHFRFDIASAFTKLDILSDDMHKDFAAVFEHHTGQNFNETQSNLIPALLMLANLTPDIADVLRAIAGYADDSATVPAPTPRPARATARRTHFIKSLSTSIRELTGQPLHEMVARTTALIFDDHDISIDLVRSVLR